MILKQVIHYPDTNSVEATWVNEEGVEVKCHSYADVQMDMLRADLGEDAPDYESLITTVEAASVPTTPPDPKLEILATIDSLERTTLMNRATREFLLLSAEEKAAANGRSPAQLYLLNAGYRKVKDVDNAIVALRAQL